MIKKEELLINKYDNIDIFTYHVIYYDSRKYTSVHIYKFK